MKTLPWYAFCAGTGYTVGYIGTNFDIPFLLLIVIALAIVLPLGIYLAMKGLI